MIERFEIDTEQWAALSQKAASAKKFLAAFDERDFGGIKSEFPQPHDAKHLAIALDYISEFIEIAAAPRPEAGQQADGVWSDTGHAEADRVINRLESSDPEFDDCADAVALIRTLIAEMKGPDGFATWKDAAVAERLRRVNAQLSAPRPVPTCERLPFIIDVGFRYENGIHTPTVLLGFSVCDWDSRDEFVRNSGFLRPAEPATQRKWTGPGELERSGYIDPAEPDGGAV